MPTDIQPGFITLHGNQLETLREAVLKWIKDNPLKPLEEEIILVQSNGVAEWLKIALAEEIGICASTQVTLPGRFLWQAYRSMLGRDRVSARSPFDKAPLTWRLMRLLPTVVELDGYAPLRAYLVDAGPDRLLQLSQRLADLFDQYQVYRADWLHDWAAGRDVIRDAREHPQLLPADQVWQACLWRLIVASVDDCEHLQGGRADVHQRFVAALEQGLRPAGKLPRRVIVFGIAALPLQTMQALSALSTETQVLVAIPNPCQYFWGDIISGRELFQAQRRRQAPRVGQDMRAVALEDLHAHCHPLLAAWGRLGRDFVRMLDAFDDVEATRRRFNGARVDVFSEGQGDTMLAQLQAAIRDCMPIAEHAGVMQLGDASIEFHATHGVQREVEVLHDRLLTLLAKKPKPGGTALRPRDIIVMVPDVALFAPSIEAVFGQYGDRDRRLIPYAIADTTQRRRNPLLVALEWLLRLPDQRCLQSEIRDLLDVPAVAQRLDLDPGDLPRLARWIEGAGVRWGLDREHRAGLGLAAADEQNGWLFGLRRMLMGYANGEGADFRGIEPFAEVGGLDAGVAGALGSLVETLIAWRGLLLQDATPTVWVSRARLLLADFFAFENEDDRQTLARLDHELGCWLDNCDGAGFAEPVPLSVMREAWLGNFDDADLHQRFVSGGVTFCTLLPMRAIPFRVVCLLGMNDGDFPRRVHRADFDLLALADMARPGDRSRRDDDRYLMLEACLSARDKLYVSWVGHSVRDSSHQPPSVLVAQLQDYLRAGWNADINAMTVHHPLQPFSRRYFENDGFITYAREWRIAHDAGTGHAGAGAGAEEPIPMAPREPERRVRMADLARFLRQPATYFFRHRLQVIFTKQTAGGLDVEPFSLDKLEQYGLVTLLHDDRGTPEPIDQVDTVLAERAARLAREGVLPFGLFGQSWQEELVAMATPGRRAWLTLCARYDQPADKAPVLVERDATIALEDWIDGLRTDGRDTVWLAMNPGQICLNTTDGLRVRLDKVIDAWVRQLACAAGGLQARGYLVGRDAVLAFDPISQKEARAVLVELLGWWQEGLDRPLPTACKTALAMLTTGGEQAIYEGGFNNAPPGEVKGDPVLARLWPNFASLTAAPGWDEVANALYQPLAAWTRTGVHILSSDELTEKESA